MVVPSYQVINEEVRKPGLHMWASTLAREKKELMIPIKQGWGFSPQKAWHHR